MAYQRQMGEAVNVRAALPDVTRRQMYNYDEAIRRRLDPIASIGDQQNAYSARRAQEAQQAAYQQRLAALNAAAQNAASSIPAANGQWFNPLGNLKAPISFTYGAKYRTPVAGNEYHQGVDFGVKAGTPVYAPYSGTLQSFGMENSGFGDALRLNLSNGLLGILGHLSGFAPNLKAGMAITPGMLLGYSGNTGNSTGDHLHYELRDKYGNPIDPRSYYGW